MINSDQVFPYLPITKHDTLDDTRLHFTFVQSMPEQYSFYPCKSQMAIFRSYARGTYPF